MNKHISEQLIASAQRLNDAVKKLHFSKPTAYVYNPLEYAWISHQLYLEKYGNSEKKVIFLGMNPGPWGMAQTGVPFGEVMAVKTWLEIETPVSKPENEHPKRPVLGFSCPRSEISGLRFWKLFADRFGQANAFFERHFVANYCPLAFMESSSLNRTPDKLHAAERIPLLQACDKHLREIRDILQAEWLIGVGHFSASRIREVFKNDSSVKTGFILHPSPASPAANRNWSGAVEQQLIQLGIWE